MKYLVVSDIHGSLFYTHVLENIIKQENIDKIILLGDLYSNGYRRTFNGDESLEVSSILNKYKDKIICTRGNCDSSYDEKISEFKFEDYIELNINGVDFFFSHGNRYNMDNIPPKGNVVVFGHYHVGFIEEQYDIIFANPGSISYPRNNSKHSYLIINDEEIILKDEKGLILDKKRYI